MVEDNQNKPKKEWKKKVIPKLSKDIIENIERIQETLKSIPIPKIPKIIPPKIQIPDILSPEIEKIKIQQERHLEIKNLLDQQLDQLKENFKNEMKKSKWSLIISILAITISFIGSIYGVYFAYTLNEPYLIPRDPILNRIWMVDNNFGKWEFEYVGEKITKAEICFYNEGRAPTGSIYAHWDYNISWLNPSWLYIDNIPGGNTNCTKINMVAHWKICEEVKSGETQLKCNKSQIPNGTQKIKLIVNCKFCPKSKFDRNITICIFEEGVPQDYLCE